MYELLLRQKYLPGTGKIKTFGYEKNRIILNKINQNLPELMSRNLKLGQSLKNKLKVSSFMNNSEIKNQKYLKYFVLSSDKRVKDLKVGLKLKKVMKKGIKNLAPVCNNINKDIIIKNSDYLIGQKKLIENKTQPEIYDKADELLKGIKYVIKPVKKPKRKSENSKVKSISEEQFEKAKELMKKEMNKYRDALTTEINNYIYIN